MEEITRKINRIRRICKELDKKNIGEKTREIEGICDELQSRVQPKEAKTYGDPLVKLMETP